MNSLVLIPRRTGVRYAQVMVGAAHAADDGAVTTAGPCGTTASVGDIGVVLAADHADRPFSDFRGPPLSGALEHSTNA